MLHQPNPTLSPSLENYLRWYKTTSGFQPWPLLAAAKINPVLLNQDTVKCIMTSGVSTCTFFPQTFSERNRSKNNHLKSAGPTNAFFKFKKKIDLEKEAISIRALNRDSYNPYESLLTHSTFVLLPLRYLWVISYWAKEGWLKIQWGTHRQYLVHSRVHPALLWSIPTDFHVYITSVYYIDQFAEDIHISKLFPRSKGRGDALLTLECS